METGGRSGRGEGGGIPGAGDVVVAREEGDLHWRVHAHDALGGIVVRVQIETLGRRAAPRLAGCGGWGERRGRATALWARAVVPAEALLVPHPAAPQTKVDTTAALGADKGAHLIERPALAAPLLAHVLCGPAGGPRIDAGRRAAGHRRARGLGCIGCGRGLTEPAISLLVAGLTAAQAEIAMADAAGAQVRPSLVERTAAAPPVLRHVLHSRARALRLRLRRGRWLGHWCRLRLPGRTRHRRPCARLGACRSGRWPGWLRRG